MDLTLLSEPAGIFGVVLFILFIAAFLLDVARRKPVKPRPLQSYPLARPSALSPNKEISPEPELTPAPIVESTPTAAQPAAQAEKDVKLERDVERGADPTQFQQRKAEPAQPAEEDAAAESLIERMRSGLAKTRANLTDGISNLFLGQKAIDAELLEELESQLLMADVGVEATQQVVDQLTAGLERHELEDVDKLRGRLRKELKLLLDPCTEILRAEAKGTYVILMVGVNGAGKTTTIGKLAKYLQAQGKSVMLAAGDTFRAAAVEQLQEWGARNQVSVVAQHTGADSASVVFDALESARARGIDVLIADTAGRLQNKENLMAELSKVKRVMAKLDADAPHEVMLVLDAGTGQNALSQATLFNEAVGVTGITLTKLDGTAKGGVIFAIARQLQTPIRFIGVGEKIDDLKPFQADQFIEALFD